MTDWKISETAWQDRSEEAADDYAQAQRRAFIDGFEAAVRESERFDYLRQWIESQRDAAAAEDKRVDDDDIFHFAQRMTYINVLVKLSEIGCKPTTTPNEDPDGGSGNGGDRE